MAGDPLVSAAWLAEHIDTPEISVLDASWVPPFLTGRPNGKALYRTGHIPGASYFDIDDIADPQSGLSHMLPPPALFSEKVGALGVDNDTLVIVYDQNGFFASARAWWMFRAMGHTKVHVLDGGFKAWQETGGAVETALPGVEPQPHNARLQPALVRNMSEMREHVDAGDIAILDARDTGRFNGTAPEPRAGLPSGHMPGSVCVPASALLNADGTLKSTADLSPVLADYVNGPVVTSCGSGVSAAIISLAMARLGQDAAALYDGSWSEWAAHSGNPIETAS